MSNLFIVESPAKIKKICSILGKSYTGMSSYGHIMDLDRHKMSIDFDNNFEPIYVVNDEKKKVVKDLITASKSAKIIYIATDKDREGEMIGWNISQVLRLTNPKRITFTSITKKALTDAIKDAKDIDYNMVYSQKCRRVIDRIVGFRLSPLLDTFMESHNLSAGRVQSVVARLIVDRENEIYKFFSKDIQSWFIIHGYFPPNIKAQLYTKKDITKNPFKGETTKISTKDEATNILTTMGISEFKIEHIFTKSRYQSPPAPYTTNTMQQDASSKMSFNGKRTMLAAQHLYEAGYITYMRTDAITLSDEAILNIGMYITNTYPNSYYRKTIYKSNDNAQGAHECIRPTDVNTTELELYDRIGNDEIRLYNLIWKRTVASQMSPAEFSDLNIQISISKLLQYYLSTCVPTLTFDGYLILYKKGEIEEDEDEDSPQPKINAKSLKKGEILNFEKLDAKEEHEKPPPRYNEQSLLNKLDVKNLNIGRPATLVTIIQKILEKKYVTLSDTQGKQFNSHILTLSQNSPNIKEEVKPITLSQEKKRFLPTKLGIAIVSYLTLYFSKIVDYQFTTLMEQKLDDIANGKLIWHEVIKEFYDEFQPLVMGRLSFHNIAKGEKTKLLGKHHDKDIYITTTIHGPCLKFKDGMNTKFVNLPPDTDTTRFTLEQSIPLILGGNLYPKLLGLMDKKQITLKKNHINNTFYIQYNKKTYNAPTGDITLEEAKNIIKSNGKTPLKQIIKGDVTCLVLQGKTNKYLHIINAKTKKSFNVPLPEETDINTLTPEKINDIVKNAYKRKKPL